MEHLELTVQFLIVFFQFFDQSCISQLLLQQRGHHFVFHLLQIALHFFEFVCLLCFSSFITLFVPFDLIKSIILLFLQLNVIRE